MIMAEDDTNRTRNERWFKDHAVRGMTIRAIAVRDGAAVSTVHAGIKLVRGSIPEKTREDAIRDVLEFYDAVRHEAFKIAEMVPAPVTVGKDGEVLYDPETGVIVRDYSGRLRAYETAMRTVEAARKMLGLDAAVKVDMSTTDQSAAERAAKEAAARLEQPEEGTEA